MTMRSLFRELVTLKPREVRYQTLFGKALKEQGKVEEATASYRKALVLYRNKATQNPDDASAQNNAAWYLATCPIASLRNPEEAVALAEKAVQLDSDNGGYWNTLGAAQYRVGDWQAAIEALDKSSELQGDNGRDFFFLAMAHWQLDNKERARTMYDKAVDGMEEHDPDDEEHQRFRSEAAELLGIKQGEPKQDQPQSDATTDKQ